MLWECDVSEDDAVCVLCNGPLCNSCRIIVMCWCGAARETDSAGVALQERQTVLVWALQVGQTVLVWALQVRQTVLVWALQVGQTL